MIFNSSSSPLYQRLINATQFTDTTFSLEICCLSLNREIKFKAQFSGSLQNEKIKIEAFGDITIISDKTILRDDGTMSLDDKFCFIYVFSS